MLIDRFPISIDKIKTYDDYALLDYITEIVESHITSITQMNKTNILYTSDIGDIEEYTILMKNNNPYKYYPLDRNLNLWKDNRIIENVKNDSEKFTLTLINDKLSYGIDKPELVINVIDIIGLLVAYYKYTKLGNDNIRYFIRNFLLKPFILHSVDKLIMRYFTNHVIAIYMEYVINGEIIFINNAIMYDDKRLSFINKNLEPGLKELSILTKDYIQGNITTTSLLRELITPNNNMVDYIIYIGNLGSILPDYSADTLSYEFLKDYDIVNSLLYFYSMYPNPVKYKNLKRILKMTLNKYKNNNIIDNYRDPIIKGYLKKLYKNLINKI
jgi:hypothetical protein